LRLEIGSRLPIATTAVGRACLAAETPENRKALLERMRLADPSSWPHVERSVEQAITELSTIGCVTSFGAWRGEINAIATPLALGKGLPLIVANSAAPARTISEKTFRADVGPRLVAAARNIEERYFSRSTA
jgi:DNA-binding IclR family transcriptional regulator